LVLNSLPKIALVGLKARFVTPIVNVSGAGGSATGTTTSPSAGFGAGAALVGEKEQPPLQNYLLEQIFKNATLSFEAFFSTMAHFTPPSSSNS
jgi:hypothetical protein